MAATDTVAAAICEDTSGTKPLLESDVDAGDAERRGPRFSRPLRVALASGLLIAGALLFAGTKLPEGAGPAEVSADPELIEKAFSRSSRNTILNYHNAYRCMHGAKPLKWSNKIARSATEAVKKYGFEHSTTQYGENLAWGSGSQDLVGKMKMWYDEIKHTPGGTGKQASFSMNTGHYTAMVWKGTEYIGCGFAKKTLNCRYSAAGNMQGAFSENVQKKSKTWEQCAR